MLHLGRISSTATDHAGPPRPAPDHRTEPPHGEQTGGECRAHALTQRLLVVVSRRGVRHRSGKEASAVPSDPPRAQPLALEERAPCTATVIPTSSAPLPISREIVRIAMSMRYTNRSALRVRERTSRARPLSRERDAFRVWCDLAPVCDHDRRDSSQDRIATRIPVSVGCRSRTDPTSCRSSVKPNDSQ